MKRLDPFAIPLEGLQLVEASAGTGKTHTITTLLLRLLLERRLGVEQILVVTFTKAATSELRDRVRKRLWEACQAFEHGTSDGEIARFLTQSTDRVADHARLVAALRAFDQASIFTIHGFCQRALSEHAFESGQPFELELVADQRALLRELVEDYWSEQLSRASDAMLAHVRGGKVSLERWVRLASAAAAAPDVEVHPRPRRVDVFAAMEGYFSARHAAAQRWPGARAEVERLLTAPGVLKQNVYRPDRVATWLCELDAWLARDDLTLGGVSDAAGKLAPAALAEGTRKGARTPEHEFFQLVATLHQRAELARAELDAWKLALEHGLVERVRAELHQRKLALGVQSFDDLLQQLARALAPPGGELLAARLRERFPAALVDEFQDTDPVQYEIFRRVYLNRGGALFLIGDPKQAIYAFRGADIFSYLAAARDAGDAAWTLATNHRSDPSLVGAVNTLFARADQPFVLDGIEFSPVEPKPGAADRLSGSSGSAARVEIAYVAWEPGAGRDGDRIVKDWSQLPSRIAAHVAQTLEAGLKLEDRRLGPGDIAILTRKNKQAFEVQAELRRLGIPSVLLGDQSVFDSPQASELSLVLSAVAAPGNEAAVLSALSTSLFGLSALELAGLRDDEGRWERHVGAFRNWQSLWQRHGFVRAFRSLLRDEQAVVRVLALPDGDRRLTNFLHLAELLHHAESVEHLGIAGVRRWFEDARFDVGKRGDMAPDAQQLRLESDEDAVKLTTMHKSKGLEYPVVFCPYLWDGTHVGSDEVVLSYHDPDAGLAPRLHLGAPPRGGREYAWVESERRAENMRLCYVALTRAKHRTSLVWGKFRTAEGAPLAELLHATASGGADGRAPGERVRLLDSDALRSDLQRVLTAAPDCLELTDLALPASRLWAAPPSAPTQLEARETKRRLDSAWRSASFSALVAAGRGVSVPAALGRDVDEGTSVPSSAAVDGGSDTVRLHAFPRGAKSGDALHELLESIDFQDRDPARLGEAVRRTLARHGIDERFGEVLSDALGDWLDTPLLDGGRSLTLRDVGISDRFSELEFTCPVVTRPGRAAGARLGPKDLARAFAELPDGLVPGYPEQLEALGFQPLEGYLRGFIDLVFLHDGRWYVADYKSNFLGPRAVDYEQPRLAHAMAHHHYLLQAHLYSLAVHRYLTARLPGYRYETGFGGILYLFLRGMSPARGPSTGVFFHRPPEGRIEALSAALSGRNRARTS